MERKLRFKILTYPKFQLSLLTGNILVMAIIFLNISFFVDSGFSKLISEVQDPAYREVLLLQSSTIKNYLLSAFILAMVISSCWMLYLSHLLAGPILRLRSFFTDISEGKDWSDVQFRKGDFFTDLPPLINKALHVLTNKHR